MDIVYDLDDSDYQGSILNAVVRYLSRYSRYDEYLAENVSSSVDEAIGAGLSQRYQLFKEGLVSEHSPPACSQSDGYGFEERR